MSLTTTLGSYVKTTDLNAYVTSVSLTTTLGSYARSTDLNSYVSSSALTTALGSSAQSTCLNSNASSTSLTTALGNYIPKSGGVFTGIIALSTYSIHFINTSGVTHTIDRVILEILYTNYASWKTTFPTLDLIPYVTKANATFSADITLGTNGIISLMFQELHTLWTELF